MYRVDLCKTSSTTSFWRAAISISISIRTLARCLAAPEPAGCHCGIPTCSWVRRFLANSQVGLCYPAQLAAVAAAGNALRRRCQYCYSRIDCRVGYVLGDRRALNASRPAALLAALLFTLGGFCPRSSTSIRRRRWHGCRGCSAWRRVGDGFGQDGAPSFVNCSLSAILFALQLTAGHAQAVFYFGVALLLWSALQLAGGVGRKWAAVLTCARHLWWSPVGSLLVARTTYCRCWN